MAGVLDSARGGEEVVAGDVADWSASGAQSTSTGWEIITEKGYAFIRELGRGQYGTAHLVRRTAESLAGGEAGEGSGQCVVAKIVFLDHLKDTDRALSLQEVDVLRRLSHPNVVQFHESWLHVGKGRPGPAGQEALVNVMELCAGGDLRAWLEECRKGCEQLSERLVLTLFSQMLKGIQYVHSQNILHRDLKTSNMLLDATRTVVKIGDFGIARVLESTVALAMTTLGTPYYMSPEVCKGEPYREKSDMWSLGCVLYEMCVLRRAFESQSLLGLVYCIVSERYDPVPVDRYSEALSDLVSKLLAKPADQRPSASDALSHVVMQPYVDASVGAIGDGDTGLVSEPAAVLPAAAPAEEKLAASESEGAPESCPSARPPPPPPVYEWGEGSAVPEPPPSPSADDCVRQVANLDGDSTVAELAGTSVGGSVLPAPPPIRRPAPPGAGFRETIGGSSPSDGYNRMQRTWTVNQPAAPGMPSLFVAPSAPQWGDMSLEVKILFIRIRGALLRRPRARGNWVQAFALHDTTGQGLLGPAEFDAFLCSLDLGLSRAEVSAVASNLLLGRRGHAVSIGDFSDAVSHAMLRDNGHADEAWAAGLCCELLARDGIAGAGQQTAGVSGAAVAVAKLFPSLPAERVARFAMWIPKMPDGAVDWTAAQEWSLATRAAGVS